MVGASSSSCLIDFEAGGGGIIVIREMLRTTGFQVLIYSLRIDYGFSANFANSSPAFTAPKKRAESADGKEMP